MEYTQLGATDLLVSRIGFGSAGLGNEYGGLTEGGASAVVDYAVEHGITYFDTSAYYGRGLSEERLGRALEGRRDEVVIATKGGRFDAPLDSGFDFSYAGIIRMCDESLGRLRTDRIDVYQLHDIEFGSKDEVFEEAMRAMIDLKSAGKVRYIGVTGYPLPLLVDAIETTDLDTVLSYSRYNLMDRSMEDVLVPVAKRRGAAIINGSILHMGMLSERGPQDWHPAPDHLLEVARKLREYCSENGISLSSLSTQFAFANKDVDVTLLGSSKVETVRASLEAVAVPLDCELVGALEHVIGPSNLNIAWASGRQEHWEAGVAS